MNFTALQVGLKLVEPLEEFCCLTVLTDLDELDAKLNVGLRSATKRLTQLTYMANGCTRFVQLLSYVGDDIFYLFRVICSPHVIEHRLILSKLCDSPGIPSVMTRQLVFLPLPFL